MVDVFGVTLIVIFLSLVLLPQPIFPVTVNLIVAVWLMPVGVASGLKVGDIVFAFVSEQVPPQPEIIDQLMLTLLEALASVIVMVELSHIEADKPALATGAADKVQVEIVLQAVALQP